MQYLETLNKRPDARNVALYKAYLKGTEQKIADELGSNAFNALKKRLTDRLIEFSGSRLLASELSAENNVIKLIAVARKLMSKQETHTGYMLLKKAEKLALQLDHFSMLNEIYHTMIEYSHLIEQVEQQTLFSKLETNNARFLAEERLSILYASMKKQFRSGNHGILPTSLRALYQQGLQAFEIGQEVATNFRSLNQLCTLTDLYGSQTKNYHALDLFFEDRIAPLQGTEKDSAKMLGHHIELLYGMATIYFRKRNAGRTLHYLEQMHQQLGRYGGTHQPAWIGRYTNLHALYLHFTQRHNAAAALINTALATASTSERDRALLSLTLAMIHFQLGDLAAVKQLLAAFGKSDQWYARQMGNEWLFNLKAMEILLHIDLQNDQLAESRIRSFQRKFGRHLKNDKQNPLLPFIRLLNTILFDPQKVHTQAFAQKLEATIPWKDEGEDLFNVCCYGWLKARMLKQPTYETTLALLDFG